MYTIISTRRIVMLYVLFETSKGAQYVMLYVKLYLL